ncbi:MAG: DUF5663 domain-containing protein [bacterium]
MEPQQIQQQLINAFGIQELPEEKQQEVLARAGDIILKRLFLKVDSILSDEDKHYMNSIVGKGTSNEQQEITAFLEEKIPNLSEIMANEIEQFKAEFQAA